MSDLPIRKLLVCVLLVVLHLPLIYQVLRLHRELAPGSGIGDLAPPSLLMLFALFLLPHVLLGVFRIRWNPERARLNEYLD